MVMFTKQEPRIEKVSKTLTIDMFDKNVPKYDFTGEWAGRDIKVVSRTLARAYRKHVLALRRAANPGLPEPTISDGLAATSVAEPQEV